MTLSKKAKTMQKAAILLLMTTSLSLKANTINDFRVLNNEYSESYFNYLHAESDNKDALDSLNAEKKEASIKLSAIIREISEIKDEIQRIEDAPLEIARKEGQLDGLYGQKNQLLNFIESLGIISSSRINARSLQNEITLQEGKVRNLETKRSNLQLDKEEELNAPRLRESRRRLENISRRLRRIEGDKSIKVKKVAKHKRLLNRAHQGIVDKKWELESLPREKKKLTAAIASGLVEVKRLEQRYLEKKKRKPKCRIFSGCRKAKNQWKRKAREVNNQKRRLTEINSGRLQKNLKLSIKSLSAEKRNHANKIAHLKGELVSLENEYTPLIQREKRVSRKISTLEADIERRYSSLSNDLNQEVSSISRTLGTLRENRSTLLELESSIGSLENEITSLRSANSSGNLTSLKDSLSLAEDQKETANEERTAIEDKILGLRNDEEGLKVKVLELEGENTELIENLLF